MKEQKKSKIKAWLNTGTKNEVFARKMFIVLITIYILYQLGYGVGMFLAQIGF